MTTLAPHRDAPVRRIDRAPWSPRAWRQALYLTGAIPALAVVPLLLVVAALAIRPRWVLSLLVLMVALLAVPLRPHFPTATGSGLRPASRFPRRRSCRTV